MGKVFLNILLNVLAITLKWILTPGAMLYTIVWTYCKFGYELGNLIIADWLRRMAISQDQLGNVTLGVPLNHLCISSDSVDRFGDEDETISSVLGKNKLTGKLYFVGRPLAYFLNLIDYMHVERAVEYGLALTTWL